MSTAVDLVGDILLVALAAAFWVFTALYFFRLRWERSRIGRGLFSFALACSLLLTTGVLRMALDDLWVFPWLRDALYLVILLVTIQATWLLLRKPSRPRRGSDH